MNLRKVEISMFSEGMYEKKRLFVPSLYSMYWGEKEEGPRVNIDYLL